MDPRFTACCFLHGKYLPLTFIDCLYVSTCVAGVRAHHQTVSKISCGSIFATCSSPVVNCRTVRRYCDPNLESEGANVSHDLSPKKRYVN